MKGFQFGRRKAAIPIGIRCLESRHATGPHPLMLGIELGAAQVLVTIGIHGVEALLMKALSRFAVLAVAMLAMMTMASVLTGRAARSRGWSALTRLPVSDRSGCSGGGRRATMGMAWSSCCTTGRG